MPQSSGVPPASSLTSFSEANAVFQLPPQMAQMLSQMMAGSNFGQRQPGGGFQQPGLTPLMSPHDPRNQYGKPGAMPAPVSQFGSIQQIADAHNAQVQPGGMAQWGMPQQAGGFGGAAMNPMMMQFLMSNFGRSPMGGGGFSMPGQVSGGFGSRGPSPSPFQGLNRFAGPFGNGGGGMIPRIGMPNPSY